MSPEVINIRTAGLGGMGVLSASWVLAEAAFRSGFQVKKAEVHGMSQRGGSVASDIRLGPRVLSPMIPAGEVDFLLTLAPEWIDRHRADLRPGGRLIGPEDVPAPAHPRALNIVLLGRLSRFLPVAEAVWQAALAKRFPVKLRASIEAAFHLGRNNIAAP